MNMKLFNLLWALLPVGILQGSTLFTDLGPTGDVYNPLAGWSVSGRVATGESFTEASLFTLGGSGAESISEIDLAALNPAWSGSSDTFYASIWTDSGGVPGTQMPGAYWSLVASSPIGTCCGLVSITGISGLTLTGGGQYFTVLGPLSVSDDSWNSFQFNTQSVDGLNLYSKDGGTTWINNGIQLLGAFDVIGSSPADPPPADPPSVPEPSSAMLLGTALVGVSLGVRRLHKKTASPDPLS